MPQAKMRWMWVAVFTGVLLFGAYFLINTPQSGNKGRSSGNEERTIPVEVEEIRQGPLSLHRTFSGTIAPLSQFTVSPKVNGRIQRMLVEVADHVTRGQTVAQLEDAEYKQAVLEAEARLAVAEANLAEAKSRMEIAQRELTRNRTLHERGIASDSVLDTVQAEFLASQASVKVAEANVKREQAALEAARIRLGYTKVEANWSQGDDERTVAERFADEGNTVAANTPLFTIVELDPAIAVIQVTEKDYPLIALGQEAVIRSDAFPDRPFSGKVTLIAPIFKESSRQAHIELEIPNPGHLLKPGMFARCTLELERVENAISVPELAITRRNDQSGVFLVSQDGASVKWIEVKPGLQDGDRVQLIGTEISGRVVTLGQQLIKDGSAITIPQETRQNEQGNPPR